jgi:hypothetical protein
MDMRLRGIVGDDDHHVAIAAALSALVVQPTTGESIEKRLCG